MENFKKQRERDFLSRKTLGDLGLSRKEVVIVEVLLDNGILSVFNGN
jgi:hypothetical protein